MEVAWQNGTMVWNEVEFQLTVRIANRIVDARDVRGFFIDAKEEKKFKFSVEEKKETNFHRGKRTNDAHLILLRTQPIRTGHDPGRSGEFLTRRRFAGR